MRSFHLTLSLLGAVIFLGSALSDPVLKGYDVIEYFEMSKGNADAWQDGGGEQGLQRHNYTLNYGSCGVSAEFWFVSDSNRNKFIADPWHYAPRFGGFCAWGVAREFPPEWPWDYDHLGPPGGATTGWVVYNDRLYVNYHKSVSDLFMGRGGFHVDDNIAVAEERWIHWYGSLEDGPMNSACVDNPSCVHDGQKTSPSVLECWEENLDSNPPFNQPTGGSRGDGGNTGGGPGGNPGDGGDGSDSDSDSDSDGGDGGDGGDGVDGGDDDCGTTTGKFDNQVMVARVSANSAAACCDECTANNECEMWQWGSQQRQCFLLSDGTPAQSTRFTRGVRASGGGAGSSTSSPSTPSTSEADCQDDEWQCESGECIDAGYLCDNYEDCSDRSDETNCDGGSNGGGSGGVPQAGGFCSFELLNSDSGEFYMDLDVSNDQSEVSFTLTVKMDDLDSWFGIGFSDDGTMWSKFTSGVPGTDAVIREGNDVVEFNIDSYSEADIQRESSSRQDLTDTSVRKEDGYVIVEFTKPVESPSNSDDDLSFFDAQHIVWAFGVPGDEEIAYHATRGNVAISLGDCLPGCSLQLECDDKLLSLDDDLPRRSSRSFDRQDPHTRIDKIETRMESMDEKLSAIQNGIEMLLEAAEE